jgi:recombinase/recombinase-like zinc beta ribbon protein
LPSGSRFAPYGYRREVDPDEPMWKSRPVTRLVVEEAEAAIVRRVVREFLGGASMRQIARDLAREGVPTKAGGVWRQATVLVILDNPVYVGKQRIKKTGEVFAAKHEPIIDEATFQAVQELRASVARTKGGGRGRPSSGTHLFTRGMLRCGRCGAAMVPRTIRPRSKNGKPYEAYLCETRIRDKEACDQTPIARQPLDDDGRAYFANIVLDVDAALAQLRESSVAREAEAQALREQAECEQLRLVGERDRIERDYRSGDLPAHRYAELAAKIENESAAADAQVSRLREREREVSAEAVLEGLSAEAVEDLAELRAALAEQVRGAGSIDAVRAVLLRMFERFTVYDFSGSRGLAGALAGFTDADLARSDLWLEPEVRAEYAAGPWPLVRRQPLELAGNKDGNGRVR